MSEANKTDRRGFFLEQFRSLGRLFVQAVDHTVESVAGGKRYLRPPGALDETAFLLTCTRCGDCATACPVRAIKFLKPEAGTAVGTPYIDPLERPCDLCGKCMPACEPGALGEVKDPAQVRMGTAVINPETCWAHKGSICDLCYQRCPYPLIAINMEGGRPVVDPAYCTGCGQCAYVCVSTPVSIHIKPRQ